MCGHLHNWQLADNAIYKLHSNVIMWYKNVVTFSSLKFSAFIRRSHDLFSIKSIPFSSCPFIFRIVVIFLQMPEFARSRIVTNDDAHLLVRFIRIPFFPFSIFMLNAEQCKAINVHYPCHRYFSKLSYNENHKTIRQ